LARRSNRSPIANLTPARSCRHPVRACVPRGVGYTPGRRVQAGRPCPARTVRTRRWRMSFRSGELIRLAMTLLTLLALSARGPAHAEDWPCWRGPHRDGIARETGLLKEWPKDGPRQLWRAALSGGFSTVAVAEGRLFTQTKEKNQEVVVCL